MRPVKVILDLDVHGTAVEDSLGVPIRHYLKKLAPNLESAHRLKCGRGVIDGDGRRAGLASPQDNGRHERMAAKRSLLRSDALDTTLHPPQAIVRRQQEAFDAFQVEYNEDRPQRSSPRCYARQPV